MANILPTAVTQHTTEYVSDGGDDVAGQRGRTPVTGAANDASTSSGDIIITSSGAGHVVFITED